jgi:hypothetical protein
MGTILKREGGYMLVDVDEVLKGILDVSQLDSEKIRHQQSMAMKMLDIMIKDGMQIEDVAYVCAMIIARGMSMLMTEALAKKFIEVHGEVTFKLFVHARNAMRKAALTDPEMRRLLMIIDASGVTQEERTCQ